MRDISSINSEELILLYLQQKHYLKEEKEKTEQVTQKGISNSLDISRTHVSRVLNKLNKKELVEEELSQIKNHDRKLKAYHLTNLGIDKAKNILKDISDITIEVVNEQGKSRITLSDIEKKTDGEMDLINCILELKNLEENKIDLRELGITKTVSMMDDAPQIEDFVGRKKELQMIKDWFQSDIPLLMVKGQKGFGASTAVFNFIKNIENKHLIWLDLKKIEGIDELKCKLSEFLKEIEAPTDDLIKNLMKQKSIIVFDNYYEIDENVVDFLNDILVEIEKDMPLKIIVTGRKGIPVYERFYREKHLNHKIVSEIEISPLNKKEAKKVLGKDLKEDALKRIMMFTKGSPALLKYLKRGEKEKLYEMTPWEKEQISLLLYLKTETK